MRGVPSLPVDKCNIYVNIKILDRPQVETERDWIQSCPETDCSTLISAALTGQAGCACLSLCVCLCVYLSHNAWAKSLACGFVPHSYLFLIKLPVYCFAYNNNSNSNNIA